MTTPPPGPPGFGPAPYGPNGPGPYGEPPRRRSATPWLLAGLIVVVVAAAITLPLVLLKGGDDHHDHSGQKTATGPTSSPKSAVQEYLDADRTHDVAKASAVVCPAKRSQVGDPRAELGLSDPAGMAQVRFSIGPAQTQDATATVPVTASTPGYPDLDVRFGLDRQGAGWLICGLTKRVAGSTAAPTGGPSAQQPSFNPSAMPTTTPSAPAAPTALPPGQTPLDGAVSPSAAAVGWLIAKKKSDWLGAGRYVCPQNKSRATQDHQYGLFVDSGAPLPGLTWKVHGTRFHGDRADVSVTVHGPGGTANADFQAVFVNAWYVCDVVKG